MIPKPYVVDGLVHRRITWPVLGGSFHDEIEISHVPATGCGMSVPVDAVSPFPESAVTCLPCLSKCGDGDRIRQSRKEALFLSIYGGRQMSLRRAFGV